MLNYSRALKNDVGVRSKSFLHALLKAPLCAATMGIFSHCANTNFATHFFSKWEAHLLHSIKNIPSPSSLHNSCLPLFCAFLNSFLYIPSAENRASNIKLELPISWHKQTQKSRQNKLSHFCIICALISESKTLLVTNEKWCGFLHDKRCNFLQTKLTQLWRKACLAWDCLVHGKKFHETHLHLPLRVLEMKDFPFCEWPAFLAAPLMLGQNFYAPPNSMPATNMHCHQPVSTYFSYLSNRW